MERRAWSRGHCSFVSPLLLPSYHRLFARGHFSGRIVIVDTDEKILQTVRAS